MAFGIPFGSGSGGEGEVNTASNVGGGVGVYYQKVDVDFQFNTFDSDQFSVTDNVISLDAIAHSDTTGQTVNDHHNQSHGSADHSGNIGTESQITFSITTGHSHDGVGSKKVDHGNLSGLLDDDHTQYYLRTEIADAEPGAVSSSTSGQVGSSTDLAREDHNHDLGTHDHSDATKGGTIDHGDLDNDGTNSHSTIDTHIADAGKHREINDSGSAVTDLWSADKITTEVAPAGADTQVQFNNSGALGADANFVWNSDDVLEIESGTNNVFVGAGVVGAGNVGAAGGNSAVGYGALYSLTIGYHSVAVGYQALYTVTTVNGLTAMGYRALYANSSGGFNAAFGYSALATNTTGASNSAFGYNALLVNEDGASNSAFGAGALAANVSGNFNCAFGSISLDANTGSSNAAFGYGSLTDNVGGAYNCAFGTNALGNNTSGSWNVAIGSGALLTTTTATPNVAVGANALTANTSGANNTAVGHVCLAANTTGASNSAFGSISMDANTVGLNNSAFGYGSLSANVNGGSNSALGSGALSANISASGNVGVGFQALATNTTGANSVAIGYRALYSNNTNYGIAIGYQAGYSETATRKFFVAYGSSNPFLEGLMDNTGTTGTLKLRGDFLPSTTEQYDLGSSALEWNDCYLQNAVTVSDERRKDQIEDSPLGLDFINKLRPVRYKWKDFNYEEDEVTKEAWDEASLDVKGKPILDEKGQPVTIHHPPETKKKTIEKTFIRKHFGFSAQEIKATLDAEEIDTKDFAPFVHDSGTDKMALRYSQFIPIQTKAIQELSAMVVSLQTTVQELQAEIEALKKV